MARRTLEEIKRTRSESLRNGTYNNRSTQENTVSAGEKNSVEAARQRRRASYQEAKRQYEQSRGTGTVAGNAEITPTTPKQSMQYKAIRNAALRRAEETRKKQNTVGNLYSPAMDDEEETAVSKMSWDEVYPNYKAYLDNLRNTSGYVENKNYVPGSALTYGYDITKSVQNVKGMLKAKDKEEWVSKQEENLEILQNEQTYNAVKEYADWQYTKDHTPASRYKGEKKQDYEEAKEILLGMGYDEDKMESLADTLERAENAEEAAEYRADVEKDVNASVGSQIGHSAASVAANLISGIGLVPGIQAGARQLFTGEYTPVDTNSPWYQPGEYRDITRQNVSQNIEDSVDNKVLKTVLPMVYNAGMSTADNLAAAAVGGGGNVGKAVSLGTMSAGAAASGTQEAFERTGDTGRAILTGAASGLIEYGTEKISLDNLWEIARKSGKAAARNAAVNILVQSGIEGSEEATSEVANLFVDNLINGGMSDYNLNVQNYIEQGMSEEEAKKQATRDFGSQVLESFAVGSIAGGMGGGAAVARERVGTYAAGSQLRDSGAMESVEQRAEVYDDYNVQKALASYKKHQGGYQAANLYQAVAQYEAQNGISEAQTENVQSSAENVENEAVESAQEYQSAQEGVQETEGVQENTRKPTAEQTTREENAGESWQPEPVDVQQSMKKMAEAQTAETLVEAVREVQRAGTPEQIREAESRYDYVAAKLTSEGKTTTEELLYAQNQLSEQQAYEYGRQGQEVDESLLSLKGKYAYNQGKIANMQQRTRENRLTEAETADIGKAAATGADGKRFEVRRVRSVGEEPIVETGTGMVRVSELSFENIAMQNLYNHAVTQETAGAANTYLESYPAGMNINMYDGYFNSFLNAGKLGTSFDRALARNPILPKYIRVESLRNIYGAGVEIRQQEARTEGKNEEKAVIKKGEGKVIDKRLSREEEPFLKLYEKIAEKTGLDIELKDTDMEKINASFNITMGRVIFNMESEKKFGTVIHEIFGEFSEAWNGKEMEMFRTDLLEWYLDGNGMEGGEERINRLIRNYQKVYEAKEGSKAYRDAANEMLNDALEGLFRTEDGIQDFADWLYDNRGPKETRTVLQKIADLIKDLCDKIRDYLADSHVTRNVRLAMEMEANRAAEMRRRLLDIVDKAAENYRKASVQNNQESGNTERYSLKSDYLTDDDLENYLNAGGRKNQKRRSAYENGEAIILKSEKEVNDFIENSVRRKITGKIVAYKRVSPEFADRVKKVSKGNMNVAGAYFELSSDDLHHAFSKHEYANRIGDMDMKISELQNALNHIEDMEVFDTIKQNDGSNKIYLSMESDGGQVVLVELYSKSAGSVRLKTGWKVTKEKYEEKIRSNLNSRGNNSSFNTLRDNIASTDSISDSVENSTEKLKFSVEVDSAGRNLSEGQQEFFKDSKVRDGNGNLKVMYHGTPQGGFTVFKNDLAFFTDNKAYADNYQSVSASSRNSRKTESNPKTYEVYLNITKPFDIRNAKEKNIFVEDYVKGGYALGINPYTGYKDVTKTGLPSWEEADNIYEFLEDNDLLDTYDGIVVDEGGVPGENGEVIHRGVAYVTFSPNQIKNVDNTNPTESDDIRFSLSDAADLDDYWQENDGFDDTIKNAASILEEGAAVMKEKEVDVEAVRKIARQMKREYQSNIDLPTFTGNLVKVFSYLQTQDKVNYTDMLRVMNEVALPVVEESMDYDVAAEEQYQNFRKKLKSYQIKLNEQQKAEVVNLYDSYNNFRKRYFGTLNLSDKGTYLDSIWSELVDASNGYLDMDVNYAEEPLALMDALEDMKPQLRNNFGADNHGAAMDLSLRIYEEYFKDLYDTKAKLMAKQMRQERARFREKVRKEYNEKLRDVRERMRERTGTIAQRVAEVKAANTKSQLERDRREKQAQYRENIKKNGTQLINWLERPTNQKHVPEALKKITLEFLGTIDFISHRALENSATTIRWQERMGNVQRWLKSVEDSEISDEFVDIMLRLDPDFLPELNAFIDRNKEAKKISMLGYDQLQYLDSLVSRLKHTITMSNKNYGNERYKYTSDVAEQTFSDLRQRNDRRAHGKGVDKALNLMNVDMLDSITYFEKLGEGAESIFREIRKGFDVRTWHFSEAQKYMEQVLKGKKRKEIREFTGDHAKIYEFQSDGRTLRLSTGQIMTIYLLSKRPQARRHILAGGIRAMDTGTGKERIHQGNPIHINTETLDEITGILTEEQRDIADKMQKFLAENCAEWGNHTSMLMYNYKKFTDKHYFPIKVDQDSIMSNDKNNSDNALYFAIRNQGMTKNLDPEAKNALEIGDVMDVFVQHVVNMANYDAFAAPLTDAMNWFNHKNKSMDGEYLYLKTVKGEIARVYGKQAQEYFLNLVKAINGELSATGIGEGLVSRYKAASVGANLRVAIQQPTAIMRALMEMNPVDIMTGFLGKPHIRRAKNYSAIALWKSWGFYETSMGQSLKQIITGQSSIGEMIRDKASILSQLGDEITWGYIWNACENEVRRKNKRIDTSSEDFYKKVAERFDEVIDKTQVVDTVLHKSQFARSKNGLNKLEAAFMNEPYKTFNMLYRAVETRDPKIIGKAVMVYGMTAALTSFASALIDAIRDDEEEKTFGEKFLGAAKENFADNANPLNMIPFVRNISSILDGYDVERMDMAGIANLFKTGQQVVKYLSGDSKKTPYGLWKGIIRVTSQVTGIPAYNLMRDVEGIVETIIQEPILENQESAGKQYERLARYSEEGNVEKYEELYNQLLEDGLTEDEIASGEKSEVKASVKERYLEGTITQEDAIEILKQYEDLTDASGRPSREKEEKFEQDMYWTFRDWEGKEENEDYKRYGDFLDAVDSFMGDGSVKELKNVVKEYTDNGITAQALSSQITSQYKDEYVRLYKTNKSEASRLKAKLLSVYQVLGYDRRDKNKAIDRWLED